jgi:hypothetical protein
MKECMNILFVTGTEEKGWQAAYGILGMQMDNQKTVPICYAETCNMKNTLFYVIAKS